MEGSGLRRNPQCELMSRSTCVFGTVNGGEVPEERRWEQVSASRPPWCSANGKPGKRPTDFLPGRGAGRCLTWNVKSERAQDLTRLGFRGT